MLLASLLILGSAQGQTLKQKYPEGVRPLGAPAPIICYADKTPHKSHIPIPKELRDQLARNGRLEERSTFVINYSSDYPGRAKPAMEFAVSVWAALLPSDVPIVVDVDWLEQEDGVLASAGPTNVFAIDGGPKEAFYPTALAEKLLGQDLNLGQPDINVFVGNRDDWYFGTDGNPSPVEFDLASTLLHELAHGLGFSSFNGVLTNYDGGTGSLGGATSGDPEARIQSVYTVAIENGDGENLFNDFENNSTALGSQLVGNDLFYNAPIPVAELGERPKLYAPSTWAPGSSIAHLDDNTYQPSNENSLMTSAAAPGESTFDPGITFEMFVDMGWIGTRIDHDPLGDTENSSSPYPVLVEIVSDTTYDESSVKMFYSYDNSSFTEVDMTRTGNGEEYIAEIPTNGDDITVYYYLSVADALDRTYTAPAAAEPGTENVYSFKVGNDTEAPTIIHDPIPFILSTATSVDVIAAIEDNLDQLPAAIVEYSINGEEQTPLVMELDPQPRLQFVEQTFSTAFAFEPDQIQEGDLIEYRIVATDASENANAATAPADGSFFQVPVSTVSEVADEYANDFEDPATASDFIGDDFIFDTPDDFDDGALHSPHPYPFGDEIGQTEINIIHQLKTPIRVAEERTTAVMSFEEVVLVEPGNPGTSFGQEEFWDYVIVEGSNDNGTTWQPLLDGYDCTDDRTWQQTYEDGISGNDSEAVGNEGLFRDREINLQNTFEAGEEILIRFRLFSDPFARGWGWAIDNLFIQTEKPLEAPVAKEAEDVLEESFTAGWFAVREAETYELDVSTSSDFSSFLTGFNAKEIDGFSDAVTGLESGQTYYYRVRAKAGDRVSPNSNVISVTTEGGTTTGIEEYVNENAFTVYPNPTNGELSLDVEFVKAVSSLKVRVTDMLGKTLMNETYQPTGLDWQQRISLSGKSAGMYLVTLEVDGGVLTKKVFLNR